MTRKGMPSKKKILSFWNGHDLFIEQGVEINGSDPDCFACGNHVGVERAHILPVAEGGSNSEENLHLLCKGCHSESENLSGKSYWNWLVDMNLNHYEMAIERVYKKMQVNPEHWIRGLEILKNDPKSMTKYNLSAEDVDAMISEYEGMINQ